MENNAELRILKDLVTDRVIHFAELSWGVLMLYCKNVKGLIWSGVDLMMLVGRFSIISSYCNDLFLTLKI